MDDTKRTKDEDADTQDEYYTDNLTRGQGEDQVTANKIHEEGSDPVAEAKRSNQTQPEDEEDAENQASGSSQAGDPVHWGVDEDTE